MTKATHLSLGRRERQLTEAIFRLGRATVGEVLAELPDPPSYSAVRAMLGKLEKKGFVRHQEDGPRYVYLPGVPTERARRTAMQNLVETFFQGSAESAAAALLGMTDTEVDPSTISRLATKVAQARQEGR
ncbi:MAG TPA: BlaI/MecI/CopY family transcriptional regulator [Gemmatimonadales bacterium]|jgi:predicted transcriptional regulator